MGRGTHPTRNARDTTEDSVEETKSIKLRQKFNGFIETEFMLFYFFCHENSVYKVRVDIVTQMRHQVRLTYGDNMIG